MQCESYDSWPRCSLFFFLQRKIFIRIDIKLLLHSITDKIISKNKNLWNTWRTGILLERVCAYTRLVERNYSFSGRVFPSGTRAGDNLQVTTHFVPFPESLICRVAAYRFHGFRANVRVTWSTCCAYGRLMGKLCFFFFFYKEVQPRKNDKLLTFYCTFACNLSLRKFASALLRAVHDDRCESTRAIGSFASHCARWRVSVTFCCVSFFTATSYGLSLAIKKKFEIWAKKSDDVKFTFSRPAKSVCKVAFKRSFTFLYLLKLSKTNLTANVAYRLLISYYLLVKNPMYRKMRERDEAAIIFSDTGDNLLKRSRGGRGDLLRSSVAPKRASRVCRFAARVQTSFFEKFREISFFLKIPGARGRRAENRKCAAAAAAAALKSPSIINQRARISRWHFQTSLDNLDLFISASKRTLQHFYFCTKKIARQLRDRAFVLTETNIFRQRARASKRKNFHKVFRLGNRVMRKGNNARDWHLHEHVYANSERDIRLKYCTLVKSYMPSADCNLFRETRQASRFPRVKGKKAEAISKRHVSRGLYD